MAGIVEIPKTGSTDSVNIFTDFPSSQNQFLYKDKKTGISVYLKREDLLHPEISGNKFRKLKYNLLEAKKLGKAKLLSFGGAFSNHIHALAFAGKEFGFKTIGVIRGDELGVDLTKTLLENPTLKFAVSHGMELFFLGRKDYREKESEKVLEKLNKKFGDFHLLPEGGTNELAIKGCTEILAEGDKTFDYVCCPVGTGGTLAGILESSKKGQVVLGFAPFALQAFPPKGENFSQKKDVEKNHQIITKFHFGGYAKTNDALIGFINRFKTEHDVLLDPIYTGKMMFGICEMIEQGHFQENTCILAIHTGGLQGIAGMNKKLEKKGMTKIKLF